MVLTAIQIERSFTKEQIFTLYGNQIYLGHGMYGFEAASEFYFSKHASELNLTEAALLAGLPKGPVAYSPLLNPEKALRRRNLVLSEMENDSFFNTHSRQAEPPATPRSAPCTPSPAVRRSLPHRRSSPVSKRPAPASLRSRPARRYHRP